MNQSNNGGRTTISYDCHAKGVPCPSDLPNGLCCLRLRRLYLWRHWRSGFWYCSQHLHCKHLHFDTALTSTDRPWQAIATIITLIYIFVATYSQPIIYQYWAILGLEIFCLIFWLISFALLASEVAVAASYDCGGYYDGYGDYVEETCSSATLGIIGLFGACAGVGGIEL